MKNEINKIAKNTNYFLKKFINNQNSSHLVNAMKYGLFPGGKKIRSKILVDFGSLFSISYKTLIQIGAAVEAYTLTLLFMTIYLVWIMIKLDEEKRLHM